MTSAATSLIDTCAGLSRSPKIQPIAKVIKTANCRRGSARDIETVPPFSPTKITEPRMGQFQLRELPTLTQQPRYCYQSPLLPPLLSHIPSPKSHTFLPRFTPPFPKLAHRPTNLPPLRPFASPSRFVCRINNGSDIISHFELEKPEERRKPEKRVNGVFWIILLNLGIFVADHFFQVRAIKSLYLYHNWPVWYQFVTATFCHGSWEHLSSNLFFLYIFGKLVEEEEGNFALWLSYIVTGVGANLVSWLVLPRNAVSVGASGAVFGLFAISVLVKITWDWRKILEVLILGQFVIEKVMEAAQASAALTGTLRGSYPLQSVNHIAHLSGALIGVVLVWLVSRLPSPLDQDESSLQRKSGKTP